MLIWLLSVLLGTTAVSGQSHPHGAIHNRQRWIDLDPSIATGAANPPPPVSRSWADPSAEIFVTITNYRDDKCGNTLQELFSKAANPDRVFVGLVQQRTSDDVDCLARYCALAGVRGRDLSRCPHFSQIRSMLMSIQEARGPMFARSFHKVLVQDEEFCLQVDSHIIAEQNWDTLLTQMWGQAQNEYAVLSTSPKEISQMSGIKNLGELQQVPHLCHHYFSDTGIPRNVHATAALIKEPLLAASWSPGFSFAKCHMDEKVPYDPNLPSIAEGEEFTRYTRLWTAGYDVYTPPAPVFYHDYSGVGKNTYDPTEWAEMGMNKEFVRQEHDAAVRRMLTLLGRRGANVAQGLSLVQAVEALGKYGLGTKRTLDQFIQFTGVDVRSGVVFKDSCKQLQWVPMVPDVGPRTEQGDAWGRSAELVSSAVIPPLYKPPAHRSDAGQPAAVVRDMLVTLEHRAEVLAPAEVGAFRQILVRLSSWMDPFVTTLRAPFIEHLGTVRGEQTFKIFLATVPLFMAVIIVSLFVLLPELDDPLVAYSDNTLPQHVSPPAIKGKCRQPYCRWSIAFIKTSLCVVWIHVLVTGGGIRSEGKHL